MSYTRPVQYRSICPEQPFQRVFENPAYSYYFLKEIQTRGWPSLLYTDDAFYYEPLVYEFYSSVKNYHIPSYNVQLNWRGTAIIISPESLSQITRIPLITEFSDPFSRGSVDFELMLGNQAPVMANTLGVSTQSLCVNQLIFRRWLCCNLMSITNLATIYPKHAKVFHSFHTKERNLCINRILLRTIMESIRNQRSRLALPVLITRLMLQMTTGQLAGMERTRISQTPMAFALANCIQRNWPQHLQGHDASRSSSPDINMDDPSSPESDAASPLPAGVDMRSLTQREHNLEASTSKEIDLKDPTNPWDDWESPLPRGKELEMLLFPEDHVRIPLLPTRDNVGTSSSQNASTTSSPPNFEDREWIDQLNSPDLWILATKIWEGNAKLNRRIKRVEEKLKTDGSQT